MKDTGNIERNRFRSTQDLLRTLQDVNRELGNAPEQGRMNEGDITKAMELEKPINLDIKKYENNTVNVTGADNAEHAIDFSDPRYDLTNAAGRQNLLRTLAGDQGNTVEGHQAVRAALDKMANDAGSALEAETKERLRKILGNINENDTINASFSKDI